MNLTKLLIILLSLSPVYSYAAIEMDTFNLTIYDTNYIGKILVDISTDSIISGSIIENNNANDFVLDVANSSVDGFGDMILISKDGQMLLLQTSDYTLQSVGTVNIVVDASNLIGAITSSYTQTTTLIPEPKTNMMYGVGLGLLLFSKKCKASLKTVFAK